MELLLPSVRKLGAWKFVWFKILKNSARNWTLKASETLRDAEVLEDREVDRGQVVARTSCYDQHCPTDFGRMPFLLGA